MNTLLSALVQVVNLPSVLLYFVLESLFPNANNRVLEGVALSVQWASYVALLLLWLRAHFAKSRKP
jgi:hypothetical protein